MSSFNSIFRKILKEGKIVSPRGQKTLELQNETCHFFPYERFANFPSRKLSLNYIRKELCWYLKGDPKDLSIAVRAKLWYDMVTNGALNSNYGKYIFVDKQIDYVVECLSRDKDSRRALINIMGKEHLFLENKDVPCTVSLGFTIRNLELRCCVHMRSTDAIYGMSNDIPFFSFIHECVYVYLQAKELWPLKMGSLTLFSESLHVYQKHWDMLKALVKEKNENVICPLLSGPQEIDKLRSLDFSLNPHMPFTTWLMDVK